MSSEGVFYGCVCGAMYERWQDRDSCAERGHDGRFSRLCPQCARFREKLDREKMAVVVDWGRRGFLDDLDIADKLLAYLTE